MPLKKPRDPKERDARQVKLEEWRSSIREGAPCPKCGAPRGQRCDRGKRKRNHQERQDLYLAWFNEQVEAEKLDVMLGRINNRG